jgi:hypothetical protein
VSLFTRDVVKSSFCCWALTPQNRSPPGRREEKLSAKYGCIALLVLYCTDFFSTDYSPTDVYSTVLCLNGNIAFGKIIYVKSLLVFIYPTSSTKKIPSIMLVARQDSQTIRPRATLPLTSRTMKTCPVTAHSMHNSPCGLAP